MSNASSRESALHGKAVSIERTRRHLRARFAVAVSRSRREATDAGERRGSAWIDRGRLASMLALAERDCADSTGVPRRYSIRVQLSLQVLTGEGAKRPVPVRGNELRGDNG